MTKRKPLEVLFNDDGKPLCSRRNKNCTNPECSNPETGKAYKFTAEQYDLLECPLCGKDRRCRNIVRTAGDACNQRHGGKTPAGLASPNLRHGKYSQALAGAGSLLERYEAAASDPRPTELRHELALVDMRIEQLVGRIKPGDAGGVFFLKVQNGWNKLRAAMTSGNATAVAEAMVELDTAILGAVAEVTLFEDIGKWIERRTRIAAAQDHHEQVERQNVSLDEFTLFTMLILEAAKDLFDDRRKLTRFAMIVQQALERNGMPVDGTAVEVK
jgi:hypothetical protein